MVLENSSSKEANESFDSIPAPDNDPYASSEEGQGQGVGSYDAKLLPQPLPIFGPLFGYNETLLSKAIKARVQGASQITNRSLRQDEIDAVAFHTAKTIRINSFAPVAGFSWGIYRAIQTAPQFRFPFYLPNLETFNPHVFPHVRMPYIRGFQAVIAWHIARGLLYCYMGQWASRMVIGGYGAGVMAVGELNDPRLKDVTKARREVAKTQNNLPSPAGIPRPPMKPGEGRPQTQKTQGYDDASPTGEAEWSGEDDAPVNSQMTPQTTPRTIPTSKDWPERRQIPAQTPAQEEEKPFDLFDDASPTNGQGINTNTTSSQSSQPNSTSTSGSAWDRIRRGEKLASNTGAPSQSQRSGLASVKTKRPKASGDGMASADSFAFSKTEEERNLAQAEAQKEFDERVEKERRGGDFSGGGDQKRW
ncbi:hypothetical protein DSL72_004694 [Monilinia vaccinii-corymbosi]|uniref:Uncharacterized protein n=1 Tax=Monilinia vaccinii-corymbosi TaxID=61207 RepID=A0A8A3P2W4_9HELO|nr:hypothetical protein DSL72_004694 [Monilinia vaccinii-corymbosi]